MPSATYWRKPGGYSVITNQGAEPITHGGFRIGAFSQRERHSFTCCHCNRVTFVDAGQHQDIGRCTCCDDLICNQCIGKPCFPLQKKMGMYERGEIKTLGPVSDIDAEIAMTAARKKRDRALKVLRRTLEKG